eukprot:TRINITY_DN3113_c0_g1_i1.p1 TRINITY_DN3113_c0_g1~~TRINITY_DN3113_c0_g1_i1.p1  ORF type:complete len:467 (+),score=24.24 TRINITY_DN3113_c0_g1_i1:94-1494(+)
MGAGWSYVSGRPNPFHELLANTQIKEIIPQWQDSDRNVALVFALEPNTTLEQACQFFLKNHISGAPVMHNNKCLGFVDFVDIAAYLAYLSPQLCERRQIDSCGARKSLLQPHSQTLPESHSQPLSQLSRQDIASTEPQQTHAASAQDLFLIENREPTSRQSPQGYAETGCTCAQSQLPTQSYESQTQQQQLRPSQSQHQPACPSYQLHVQRQPAQQQGAVSELQPPQVVRPGMTIPAASESQAPQQQLLDIQARQEQQILEMRAQLRNRLHNTSVQDLIDYSGTDPVKTCKETDSALTAASVMATGVHRMLVMSEGNAPSAVLTQTDVCRFLYLNLCKDQVQCAPLSTKTLEDARYAYKRVHSISNQDSVCDAMHTLHKTKLSALAIVDSEVGALKGNFSVQDFAYLFQAQTFEPDLFTQSVESYLKQNSPRSLDPVRSLAIHLSTRYSSLTLLISVSKAPRPLIK